MCCWEIAGHDEHATTAGRLESEALATSCCKLALVDVVGESEDAKAPWLNKSATPLKEIILHVIFAVAGLTLTRRTVQLNNCRRIEVGIIGRVALAGRLSPIGVVRTANQERAGELILVVDGK